MKSFFVGLLVLFLFLLTSVVFAMLMPLILLMGFFLRWIIAALLILFTIWLIGKVTLVSIDYMKKREERKRNPSA